MDWQLGISSAFCLVFFLAWRNWRRAHHRVELPLEPNQLLTRFPLIFISGRRSLFYFMRYWNWIPSSLRAHGYEVHELQLPWRNRRLRQTRLRAFLDLCQKEGIQAHFVADASARDELRLLEAYAGNEVLSCTQVESAGHQHFAEIRSENVGRKIRHWPIASPPLSLSACFSAPELIAHFLFTGRPNDLRWGALGLGNPKHFVALQHRYLQLAGDLAEFDLRS